MPCDTVQNSTVVFNLEATNIYLLKLALESLGYTVNQVANGLRFTNGYNIDGQFLDGKLTVKAPDGEFELNTVKKAYSTEVVKSCSKRFGWRIKQKANGKLQVLKGGF